MFIINIKQSFSKIIPDTKYGSYNKDRDTLNISHNAGFFSCCQVRLTKIIEYYNIHNNIPNNINCDNLFGNYKTKDHKGDLTLYYFEQKNISMFHKPDKKIIKITDTFIEPEGYLYGLHFSQFSNYKNINFEDVKPFIDQYFTPSQKIKDIIKQIENTYKIDYNNICTVYYRSTDKFVETNIAPMSEFIDKTELIKNKNPQIIFLLQTDSLEFKELFLNKFNNTIYIKEVDDSDKYIHSLYLLASVIIMSKTKYIISGSGNVSFWVMLYRGNALNTMQYLNNKNLPSDVVINSNFKENTTTHWL